MKLLTTLNRFYQRKGRGEHRAPLELNIGQSIPPFQLQHIRHYNEFDINYLHFVSKQWGTSFHQFQCSQQNNTLSFIFPLGTLSKSGLNYCLQKMLLCGWSTCQGHNLSDQMKLRSLSTDLKDRIICNQDYMMFSFQTANRINYCNLMKVYLKMLFQPMMKIEEYHQVICRLQMIRNQLHLKGQLVQEMSNQQFQTQNIIYSLINKYLLSYHNQTLCKPYELLDINLTDIQQFHKSFIKLNNCTIIAHGDLHSQFIIEQFRISTQHYISHNRKVIESKKRVRVQLPKTVEFKHLEKEVLLICFLIQNISQQQKMHLQILSSLLFDMPESIFMKWLSLQTPYPSLYGFQQKSFNIGITLSSASTNLMHIKKQILQQLADIVLNKFPDHLVEECLLRMGSNYYTTDGLIIIQSIVPLILQGQQPHTAFNPQAIISNLFKIYRKQNIFERLIDQYLLNNKNYLTLRGFKNSNVIDSQQWQLTQNLLQTSKKLTISQMQQIKNYNASTNIQNFNIVPEISSSDCQIFQQTSPSQQFINGITLLHKHIVSGIHLCIKIDITDIMQQYHHLIPIFCQIFPQMGINNLNNSSYQQYIKKYFTKMQMYFTSIQNAPEQIKIYLLWTIQFSQRNSQYCWNVLVSLFHDYNTQNISDMSVCIQKAAAKYFNNVSAHLVDYHGRHLASSQSAAAFMDNPIYQARSACALAADMCKVTNPKRILLVLKDKFKYVWNTIRNSNRISMLLKSPLSSKEKSIKYISMMTYQLDMTRINIEAISTSNFPVEKWMKYYPNYMEQIVFEAISIPYRTIQSPAIMVLSAIINQNIQMFHMGGCFPFKGCLISFIRGHRNKVLELEKYYTKIDNIDHAKCKILLGFTRYTTSQQFSTNISFQQARQFKQSVMRVEKKAIQQILQKYILSSIKNSQSSLLALGPNLQNYEPILKKGWEVQRSINEVSLQMQSMNEEDKNFEFKNYITII